ncbi:MAG: asparagine synthase (glutamine-hydrolyzing) [Candidatus Schekmanbacteria bacterium]|nr:MAG: asparagine synthase (glutamine-hydrolyzing) [Candidatus Schekmanbacteria bacterium]
MCGICGIYNRKGEYVEREYIRAMRDVMAHRGPDGKGEYIEGKIGLGHRRLSVIDIEGGHQPMCNEDGRYWIVYNGEIYNFKDLRIELEKKGHLFKSKCDTEVILHLYEEEGEKCLSFFNGMFAFAIWDKLEKKLFIARDRLGIKPLYFYYDENIFLFASEIKSILSYPAISCRLNREKVKEYLLFRYVAGSETLFKGIESLEPGNYMYIDEKSIQVKSYWTLDCKGDDEYGEEFSEVDILFQLKDSIKKRLISDVPLGCFCSGGIDSSLVTAIASGMTDFQLSSYSIGFREEKYDERNYARQVAKRYSTIHNEVVVDNREFSEALPKIIWFLDEPLNHANSVQIYLLSRYAKNYVTVVLTGEGADETFGGYPRYLIPKIVLSLKKLPSFLSEAAFFILDKMNNRKIKKLCDSIHLLPDEMAVNNSKWVRNEIVDSICSDKEVLDLSARMNKFKFNGCSGSDFLQSLLIYEQQTYLVSILNRADKMSMAAGLELRVPFLDHNLVQNVNRISIKKKLHFLETKSILKNIARNFLPDSIVDRKKSGFGNPIDSWLLDKEGLGKYLDIILSQKIRELDFYKKESVEKLLSEQKNGARNGSILWQLINFSIWYDTFF